MDVDAVCIHAVNVTLVLEIVKATLIKWCRVLFLLPSTNGHDHSGIVQENKQDKEQEQRNKAIKDILDYLNATSTQELYAIYELLSIIQLNPGLAKNLLDDIKSKFVDLTSHNLMSREWRQFDVILTSIDLIFSFLGFSWILNQMFSKLAAIVFGIFRT